MTYTPSRIVRINAETEEIEIDKNAVQRNLDLISKETKNLQNQINSNSIASERTRKILQEQTRFVKPFLFAE